MNGHSCQIGPNLVSHVSVLMAGGTDLFKDGSAGIDVPRLLGKVQQTLQDLIAICVG